MERAAPPGRVALALILGSQLMMTLDTSIITTALPYVQRDFSFSQAGLTWVQNAYVLAFGGLLMLGARAGDLLGRRRVFLAGITVFTVASLAAGLAPSGAFLITARAVQGLAASFAVPSTLALLIAGSQSSAHRARLVAIYSAVIGAGGSVGIVIGGVFTDLLSWRWARRRCGIGSGQRRAPARRLAGHRDPDHCLHPRGRKRSRQRRSDCRVQGCVRRSRRILRRRPGARDRRRLLHPRPRRTPGRNCCGGRRPRRR